MKRIFVLIVVLVSCSFLFTYCQKDKDKKDDPSKVTDTTKPVIKFSKDTIIVGLGEVAALLSEVSATDDIDGNLTSSIKTNISSPEQLNVLGYINVKYSVSDKAGNAAEGTRVVLVSCRNLAETYTINWVDEFWSDPRQHESDITVVDDATLNIMRLHCIDRAGDQFNRGWDNIKIVADSNKLKMVEEEVPFVNGETKYKLNGYVFYKMVNNQYVIDSMSYSATRDNISSKFTAVCLKQ